MVAMMPTKISCTVKYDCLGHSFFTKKEWVIIYLLINPNGVTENEILRNCHLSSGRNYTTLLERTLNITLDRKSERNTDGIGTHYRYRVTNKCDVIKIINLLNEIRKRRKMPFLDDVEVNRIVNLYPINVFSN